MSTSLYLKCACGAELEQECDVGEYARDQWYENWREEHKGHGDDFALSADVKRIKEQLVVQEAMA